MQKLPQIQGTKQHTPLLDVPHSHTLHFPTPVSEKSLQSLGPCYVNEEMQKSHRKQPQE